MSLWNCTPAYKGWSSAYSVQSVLLQLQTFLLQEDLLYDVRKVSTQQTVERSRKFLCEGCGHAGTKPFPAFLTPEEIEVTIRNRKKKLISNPNRSLPQSHTQRWVAEKPQTVEGETPEHVVSEDEWQTVVSKKFRSQASVKVRSVDHQERTTAQKLPTLKPKTPRVGIEEAMGHFGSLPQEALTKIMCMLSTEDVSSLSRTCRGLKVASEDGYLWNLLLHRHFPASSLNAASMEDWKHVFLVQQNNIFESLRCFHMKCTHEEEVLGFPISFTVNPRTQDVDYIQVHLDILSRGAYASGVRNTADNQKFKFLLPLYITQDHFERALPAIQATIVELCPLMHHDGRRFSKAFQPEMVLNVMPKVLNTMVVLLCDKGVGASERAIEGYCMMHRLFLALCERFNLWRQAEQEVIRFKSSPGAQTKERCPDLGRLMAQLSVCFSESTAWKEVVRPITNEVFDRTVIWICKHDPSVATNYEQAGRSSKDEVDEKLLLAAWEGSRVALRLNMFHVGFLHLLARPNGTSLKEVTAGYDALYGMPSAYLKKRIQEFVRKVTTIGYDWPFFFRIVGMQCPTKAYLTQWLGQCWKNSLRKGYHKRDTKFENIQRRGVSKILLKGESYSAPVNMQTVKMLESWRWIGDSTQFLDASCLLYSSQGQFQEVVDWCNGVDRSGAIRHSGDVIDHENQQGNHTIEINLSRLSTQVEELYFTMSGWAGATLRDFRLPFVQLKDVTTDVELCEYTLEDKTLSSHTSVIMCRMYRSEGLASRWEVEALGHLGEGSANNYGPIEDSIMELISSRRENPRNANRD